MEKRSGWKYVLPLITAVVLASVVPMADLPETAFNEIDTPVNQTTPLAPWVKIVPRIQVLAILPRSVNHTDEGVILSLSESISPTIPWHVSPLREFLCVFLI